MVNLFTDSTPNDVNLPVDVVISILGFAPGSAVVLITMNPPIPSLQNSSPPSLRYHCASGYVSVVLFSVFPPIVATS